MTSTLPLLRLLLVDDSPEVCRILRAMLSSRRPGRLRNYTVEQVHAVRDGLDIMRAGLHDCYLVDYRVGNESGLDLVRAAREAGLLVPIVMLTGSDMIDSEAAEAGANDFLVKGRFDVPIFERTVRYAIGNAESLRRMAELNASLEAQVSERTRQYADANIRLMEQIAAREQAESTLLRAERLHALGRMTGSVAHDFNNVLTALFASLEMVQTRLAAAWNDKPDPRIARPLANAIEASRMGERMVEGLLAFARRQPVAPTLLDANMVIRETERLLLLTLGSDVALHLSLCDGPAPVRADRDGLERALLNLAANARDAMAEQTNATFRISTDILQHGPVQPDNSAPPCVRITVSDNGPGMSREVLDHAFEPFFSTKGGQGTGLGLAQVYGFAQQTGGSASVESAPGSGVCVTLMLPRAS